MSRIISVDEGGRRIGEDHPHATLTNCEIETLRRLHEVDGFSYRALAEKFEVSKGAVAKICRYERRALAPGRYRSV